MVGKGTLPLFLNPKSKLPFLRKQHFTVTGGPFKACPNTYKGVKMAKEIQATCVVDIPSQDFGVPDKKVMYRGLNKAVDLILAGEPVYVGCMGGIGRTGTMLALIAKAFGIKEPVKYVRKHYLSHAVETPEQQEYIRTLAITPTIRRKIKLARRRQAYRLWTWHRQNLTRIPAVVKQDLSGVGGQDRAVNSGWQ